MAEQDAPKIEFPCADYPIKVLGKNEDNFRGFVIETLQKYDSQLPLDKVTVNDSSKGTFTSVTLFITAASEEQLKTLHQELMASGRVKVVF